MYVLRLSTVWKNGSGYIKIIIFFFFKDVPLVVDLWMDVYKIFWYKHIRHRFVPVFSHSAAYI
jgi:hypothetical protein